LTLLQPLQANFIVHIQIIQLVRQMVPRHNFPEPGSLLSGVAREIHHYRHTRHQYLFDVWSEHGFQTGRVHDVIINVPNALIR
jgi:hypothetical protein